MGWKNRKQIKIDLDVARKDASFELNPSFLALSVQKLLKKTETCQNQNEAHEKDDFFHSAFAESIEWITFMRANGTNVLHSCKRRKNPRILGPSGGL